MKTSHVRLGAALLLALLWWIGARGLLSTTALDGHDSAAYPITQQQFMENLRAGVFFPRWAPDMRFGYGHPQLQYRPPLLHYAASPIHAVTGNPFLAVNLATALFLALGVLGMYRLARTFAGQPESVLAAAGFMLANYPLANIYLRGAYYEITAMSGLPWILWAQVRMAARASGSSRGALIIGVLAWLGALTGHPAIAFFFTPVAVVQALWLGYRCRWTTAGRCAMMFMIGGLLSAPYTWGMFSERPWVRMEIFMSELETWRAHFIEPSTLLRERWPDDYTLYHGLDVFQRPRHREVRGLNTWAWALLIVAPLVALGISLQSRLAASVNRPPARNRDAGQYRTTATAQSLLAAGPMIALYGIALALPISLPLWRSISLMETFNFPWRALTITALGLALTLAALPAAWRPSSDSGETPSGGARRIRQRFGYPATANVIAFTLLVWIVIEALPHTRGWPGPAWLNHETVTGEDIRLQSGIPLEYYTPRWVGQYATAPATQVGWIVEGGPARLRLLERSPVRWRIAIDAESPARIALAHHHYPGWRIEGLPGIRRQASEPWSDRGLISFMAPAGEYTATLRFGNVGRRWVGWLLFAAGGLALTSQCRRRQPSTQPNVITHTKDDYPA